jgi:hypothetical protein
MKKLNLCTAMMAAILVFTFTGQAQAVGLGAFFEYGWDYPTKGGDLFANVPDIIADPALDLIAGNEWGVGFALDTNVAKDRLFNYRLDFGYHRSEAGILGVLGESSNGVMWNNVFGFGVLRTKLLRLYLGPAVRMNFDWYDRNQVLDYQLGVGGQLGLNVNLPAKVTLNASTSYAYKFGWLIDTRPAGFGPLPTVSHRDHYIGLNFAVFFRSGGDEFERR